MPEQLIGTEYKHLGEYLQAKRRQANLSQKQVSEELGFTTPQFISSIERGKKQLPFNKVPAIMKLYKISPHEFIQVMREEQLRIFDLRIEKTILKK